MFLRNIFFFLAICRILSTSLSHAVDLQQDSEGSGDDQEGSGLDLDLSQEDNHLKNMMTPNIRDHKDNVPTVSQDRGESRFIIPGDSELIVDFMPGHRPAVFFSEEKLKTILNSKEAIAGAIAGGVVGLILAMAVASVMIYKGKMKAVGYTVGRRTSRH